MVSIADVTRLLETEYPHASETPWQEDVSLLEQGLDSLDFSTFLFTIEKHFDLLIPTHAVGTLRNIRQITGFLNAATHGDPARSPSTSDAP